MDLLNETTTCNQTTGIANDQCSNLTNHDVNEAYVLSLRSMQSSAQSVITPVLLIFGLLGNCLTILTVSHAQFRRLTTRYILYAMAISDSLLLLTNPFNQRFMQNIFKMDVRALSDVGCKLFFIVYRTGKMSSSWFIVMVAIERFIAVLFPLKIKTIVRKYTIAIAIVAIYIYMLALTGVWTISTDVVEGVCKPDAATADSLGMHKILLIIGAASYSLLPILILSTVTPPVIVRMIQQQRTRHLLSQRVHERSSRDISRATVMLIGIVINYIVCVMPITLVLILTFWTNEPIFESKKPAYIIFISVAQTFEQLNHSSNFFIYVICGRQFRRRFVEIMSCSCRRDSVTKATGSSRNLSYILDPPSTISASLKREHEATITNKIIA